MKKQTTDGGAPADIMFKRLTETASSLGYDLEPDDFVHMRDTLRMQEHEERMDGIARTITTIGVKNIGDLIGRVQALEGRDES